jgi:transposase
MGQVTLLTGPERHRRWGDEERQKIVSAAFAPGASVAAVARRFEVATSLIYKWRQQSRASEGCPSFVSAVVAGAAAPLPAAALSDGATIVVELPSRIRVTIGAAATAALVTATLRALR